MDVVKKSHSIFSLESESIGTKVFWIAAFTSLTIVGSKIEIPHYPVPYTLQTFFVLLSGAFLGSRNGSLSQVLYLSLGAMGLPVFAGMDAGFLKFAGPTAGYLLSWPLAAALVGYMIQNRIGYWWILMSFSAGLAVIFFCGSIVLYTTVFHNWQQTILNGFLIFSWWDVLKLTAAAAIYNEFSKRYRKLPTE